MKRFLQDFDSILAITWRKIDRSRKTFYQKQQQEKLYKTYHKKKVFEELVFFVVDYPWNHPDTSRDCSNSFDELWFETGRKLSQMNCNDRSRDECAVLRQYMTQSWRSALMNKTEISSERQISFRSYCDSFWDLQSREDENLLECQHGWICAEDQQQCQSGECIESLWLNDGHWDCTDASDEHAWLAELALRALAEASRHDFTNRSYFIPSTCPQSHPFLCLAVEATQQGFSCFNLSQIGDGHIDCAGATDERNPLPHCSQSSMRGLNLLCRSTNTCVPYRLHYFNDHRCHNRSDDKFQRDRQYRPKDCFNGQYLKQRRCDEKPDCFFGEDEYVCHSIYFALDSRLPYREVRRSSRRITKQVVRLSKYPQRTNVTEFDRSSISTVQDRRNLSSNLSSLSAYGCNRGLGVLSTTLNDSPVCFCPRQYYGEKCRYHADRLSVLLHLNLSQSIYSSQTRRCFLVQRRSSAARSISSSFGVGIEQIEGDHTLSLFSFVLLASTTAKTILQSLRPSHLFDPYWSLFLCLCRESRASGMFFPGWSTRSLFPLSVWGSSFARLSSYGIAHYFLWLSVINLSFFVARLVHWLTSLSFRSKACAWPSWSTGNGRRNRTSLVVCFSWPSSSFSLRSSTSCSFTNPCPMRPLAKDRSASCRFLRLIEHFGWYFTFSILFFSRWSNRSIILDE